MVALWCRFDIRSSGSECHNELENKGTLPMSLS